jgi:Family of unknown function (DUF5681)
MTEDDPVSEPEGSEPSVEPENRAVRRARDSKERAYKVGKGKTPEHTRFQRGQSGNARGRPKKSLNFSTVVTTALRRTVAVRVNNRTVRMTKLEAWVEGNLNKAINGDARSTQVVLLLMRAANVMAQSPSEDERGATTKEDEAIFANFLKRIAGKEEAK